MQSAFPLAPVAAIALLAFPGALAAQSTPPHAIPSPRVEVAALRGSITIDGALDEAAWNAAEPARDFLQQDPKEGEPATQKTEVRFLYDADALYIGARLFDTEGARGVKTQLARRDQQSDGDWLRFVLDTYHDHLGRTIFQVNPSGVKYDAGQATPFTDVSWDPVWETAARIDSLGWTAELRIPFNQLRFSRAELQTWGMQIWRYNQRLNEISMWSPWKKDESGGPQRFGHLEGMRVARGARTVELLPYVVGSAKRALPTDPTDPYLKLTRGEYRVGGDLKALLGSNLTLDVTVNPDFGQVEADPAVVNLSAFETFFPEKRPFFVAGSGLFDFGGLNCFFCSNTSSLSLFYSRRIGRRPQLSPFSQSDVSFADSPLNSTILGAAKVTGRTAGGLSVGIIDATTRREMALVTSGVGIERGLEVEPFTNYFVSRVKRDLRGGNLTVGGIVTSTDRFHDSRALDDILVRHAQSGGVDFNARWKQQTYSLMGSFAVSRVAGDSQALIGIQRRSARWYQRPDRRPSRILFFDEDAYDPTRTSLTGGGAHMRLAKEAGPWRWEIQGSTRTPGFEVNDIAFLTRADWIWLNANIVRQWANPIGPFRYLWTNVGAQRISNYDNDVAEQQLHAFAEAQFRNYWNWYLMAIAKPAGFDDNATRGGTVVRTASNNAFQGGLTTDQRKRIYFSTNPSYGVTSEGGYNWSTNLTTTIKPVANLRLSVSPSFSRRYSVNQFVAGFADATTPIGRRAVFAELQQRTVSMDTRAAITFTPTLTLELYAQPFISTGDYSGFKEYVRPRTMERRYFTASELRPIDFERHADGSTVARRYQLTLPTRTDTLRFSNPDFNVRSLLGNAVMRWEYRPGSTLFLVWNQQRSNFDNVGSFDFSTERSELFHKNPENTFLIKVNYWLTL
ncbi:MAG TPA: DUF5916 domain-containing protein [Gemmatimonadaceae bacterium]|nr:DUF5916 domain-containing protein [Gemmatimonadaceae bacterium]